MKISKEKSKNFIKKAVKINMPYLDPPHKEKKNIKSSKKIDTSQALSSSGILELPVKDFIDNRYLIMDDGTYCMVLNISPLNSDYFDDEDLNVVKEALISALSSLNNSSRIGFYIQKEKMNLDKTLEEMQQHKEKLDNPWQESIQENNIYNLKEDAKKINNIDRFYVALESTQKNEITAKADLNEKLRVFSQILDEVGLFCSQLYKKEILNLLYKRCNPLMSCEIEMKDDAELADIVPNTAILHKEGDIIEIENALLRHICFKKFRKEVEEFSWLKKILRLDGSIFIGITLNPKPGNIIAKLDKSRSRNIGETTKSKKYSEGKAVEAQIEGIETMFEQIDNSNMVIYDVNITVSIQGMDRQSLDDTYRKLLGIIDGYRYQALRLVRKEFMPFFATLPILARNDITTHYTYNLSIDDVAATLPFSSNEYVDDNGIVYGKNLDSRGLFMLNRGDKRYHNPHLAIIADSGSGKTYAIGTIVTRELPYMDYTIMLDVVGDYKKMFPFAENYSISPHSKIIINPFYIRGLKQRLTCGENDSEAQEDSQAPITSKTLDLITFFKWIVRDMSPYQESIFEDWIRKTYLKMGISDENIPEVLNFPIMSDFFEIILEDIDKTSLSTPARGQKEFIRDILSPYVTGSMGKIFNGQTNFDYKMATIFDLSKLNKQIQPAVYDLLLNDLWNFSIKDGTTSVGNPPRKSIIIDENHELARKENPQTLDFEATKFLKQGRKYNVFVTTATQGLSDYLVIEKYGQAILDNSYFKFFMRLGETDHKVAQELYGFTDKEMKILKASSNNKQKTKGKGIFSVGGFKIPIQTFAYPSELKYLNRNDYDEQVSKGIIEEDN